MADAKKCDWCKNLYEESDSPSVITGPFKGCTATEINFYVRPTKLDYTHTHMEARKELDLCRVCRISMIKRLSNWFGEE